MKKHALKCNRGPFTSLEKGRKKSEFRLNDRGYNINDILELYEMRDGFPTGRVICATVSHIQRGYGIPEEYVMLSLGYIGAVAFLPKASCRERLGLPKETPVYEKETSFRDELMADAV